MSEYNAGYTAGAAEQRKRIHEVLRLLARDFRELEGDGSKDAVFVESLSQIIEKDEEIRVS